MVIKSGREEREVGILVFLDEWILEIYGVVSGLL